MVLSVNGRVRPVDLASVPEAEREAALRQYAETHAATQELHFEGEALVVGAAPVVPAGMPATAPTPTAIAPDAAGRPAASSAVAAAATDAALAELGLAPAPDAPAPDAPAPAVPASPPDAPALAAPPSGAATVPPRAATAPAAPALTLADAETLAYDRPLPWTYWLLPVLLTWVGGLIAWFATRARAPRQARRFLITGIVLTFVYGAVLFAVFGVSLGALYNSSVFNRKLPPVPAKLSTSTVTPTAKPKSHE